MGDLPLGNFFISTVSVVLSPTLHDQVSEWVTITRVSEDVRMRIMEEECDESLKTNNLDLQKFVRQDEQENNDRRKDAMTAEVKGRVRKEREGKRKDRKGGREGNAEVEEWS